MPRSRRVLAALTLPAVALVMALGASQAAADDCPPGGPSKPPSHSHPSTPSKPPQAKPPLPSKPPAAHPAPPHVTLPTPNRQISCKDFADMKQVQDFLKQNEWARQMLDADNDGNICEGLSKPVVNVAAPAQPAPAAKPAAPAAIPGGQVKAMPVGGVATGGELAQAQ